MLDIWLRFPSLVWKVQLFCFVLFFSSLLLTVKCVREKLKKELIGKKEPVFDELENPQPTQFAKDATIRGLLLGSLPFSLGCGCTILYLWMQALLLLLSRFSRVRFCATSYENFQNCIPRASIEVLEVVLKFSPIKWLKVDLEKKYMFCVNLSYLYMMSDTSGASTFYIWHSSPFWRASSSSLTLIYVILRLQFTIYHVFIFTISLSFVQPL